MLNLFISKTYRSSSLFLTGLLLAISSVFFSGCMEGDDNLSDLNKEAEAAYLKQLAADTLIIKKYLADHNITNFKSTKSGLFYVEQTVGTGVQAKGGNLVRTDYRLYNLAGDLLDNSYSRGETFNFRLGTQGSPIYGYQESVSLLKVGGKGTFYLPSGLAYGTGGSPPKIAPNTILIFDIELHEAKQ